MTGKSDDALLAIFKAHLRRHYPGGTGRVVLRWPLPGFTSPEEIDRIVQMAEEKWFVENVVRGAAPGSPTWSFDLTGRGREGLQLD